MERARTRLNTPAAKPEIQRSTCKAQSSIRSMSSVRTAHHAARFAGLWNEGSQGKLGSESPSELVHQRALDLLLRDSEGMLTLDVRNEM